MGIVLTKSSFSCHLGSLLATRYGIASVLPVCPRAYRRYEHTQLLSTIVVRLAFITLPRIPPISSWCTAAIVVPPGDVT